jgi:cystathionine gamma-lyase
MERPLPEKPEEVVIKVREHGPYKVTGPVRLTDAQNRPLPLPDDGKALVLCRCGRSRTKPYCDQSHQRPGGTVCVHAGLPPVRDGEPLFPSPVFGGPFHFAGDPGEGDSPFYGRYDNPTWSGWERALGELEGGEAVAFASGMAAITAVLMTTLGAGDVLVLPSDGYYTVRTLAERHLEPRGVEVRLVPTDADAVRGALTDASLLWLETPSNPGLDVVDIAELSAAAHEAGALVAVDNTLATPLRQRPLELGADISVASATKQLSGHSDVLLGYVATAEPARLSGLRAWRTETGAIPGPFETWLAHRSLATLAVRVDRQEATAAEIAALLAERPDVAWSRWPGLGCVIGLDLETAERAQAFLAASSLIAEATSFGGVHSSAERRARWGGDDVSPGLVRLSVGLEDPRDLLEDVARALDSAGLRPAESS